MINQGIGVVTPNNADMLQGKNLANVISLATMVTTATATVTSVPSQATVITLLALKASRKGVVIVNTDANDLYIKYGSGASLSAGGWTYKIGTGVTWEMPWSMIYTGIITGIWSVDGVGVAEITEL